MSVIPTPVRKDKSKIIGRSYDWRYSSTPFTGNTNARSERVAGSKYSVGHRRDPDGKYRSGGPFYSLNFTTQSHGSYQTIYRLNYYKAYTGSVIYLVGDSGWADFSANDLFGLTTEQTTESAYVYGAQAHAKLRPDKPDFTPLLTLVELLREFPTYQSAFKDFNKRYYAELRRLGSKGIVLSRAGKYHLAIQFGFMPLLNDIVSSAKAYVGAHKRAKQLLRDNGRWVRRRANLTPKPSEEYTSESYTPHSGPNNPNMWPYFVTQCYGGGYAGTHVVVKRQVEVWAVGKCKYFLPDTLTEHKSFGKLMRRIHSDTTITPELLYNLIPWSWLVDYFTRVGDLFEALSGGIADRIVFDYAYVMRKVVHDRRIWAHQYMYFSATNTGMVTATYSKVGTLKSRVGASPFGFGLKEQDLTPAQWGILGALGLSRL